MVTWCALGRLDTVCARRGGWIVWISGTLYICFEEMYTLGRVDAVRWDKWWSYCALGGHFIDIAQEL